MVEISPNFRIFTTWTFLQNSTCERDPILNQRGKWGFAKISSNLCHCIVKEVEEGYGDWCDHDYDGNVDRSQTIASAFGREVEVEVRRVGERIEPLCGQIGLLEEQWELTEGQESNNLAVNSVDSTHEDKISVKETKSSRAVWEAVPPKIISSCSLKSYCLPKRHVMLYWITLEIAADNFTSSCLPDECDPEEGANFPIDQCTDIT